MTVTVLIFVFCAIVSVIAVIALGRLEDRLVAYPTLVLPSEGIDDETEMACYLETGIELRRLIEAYDQAREWAARPCRRRAWWRQCAARHEAALRRLGLITLEEFIARGKEQVERERKMRAAERQARIDLLDAHRKAYGLKQVVPPTCARIAFVGERCAPPRRSVTRWACASARSVHAAPSRSSTEASVVSATILRVKRIKRNPDPVILAAMRRAYWMSAEQVSFETGIPQALVASRLRMRWQRGELDRQPGVGSTMTYRRRRPEPDEDGGSDG